MERTLIQDVSLNGKITNILIQDGKFSDLAATGNIEGCTVIDGSGKAIIPALYNAHTHSAMMPLRGYGDDRPLQQWLEEYVWPYEAKMSVAEIRSGYEDAIKEMISSGTVFFNDMYFEIEQLIDMVVKYGVRANIGITVMENHSLAQTEAKKEFVKNFQDPTGGRIKLLMDPHAIYTVGPERFRSTVEFARKYGLLIHTHLSETKFEVEQCLKTHGMTPVRYLDSLGVLGPDFSAAHCVHVDEQEWDILAERGVSVVHCPCSNMKLGSGRFPYEMAIKSGVRIALGTDGVSSNNNLDLREEMKFAALLAKVAGDPELLPASMVFDWATKGSAAAMNINGGEIAVGKNADCLLLDLNNPRLRPCHDLISNWVYAADSSCISSVICDGKELKSCSI